VTCTVVPLPLPNVGEIREAQREVDEYFRTNPPARVPFNQWALMPLGTADDDVVLLMAVEP
jgi:hypothetical protein